MAAGAGLGTLAAFEMKRLRALDLVPGESEPGGCQLVEIPGIGRLLLGQHAALAGADARAGQLGAPGQGDLGLLGQGAEAHVRDENGDVQPQRFLRPGSDD